MNSIDFCFWLQGYFEISGANELTPEQVKVVRNHLHLVFKHEIDPLRETQTTTSTAALNETHGGLSSGNDLRVRC